MLSIWGTVKTSNCQFETKSGIKYWENIYKGDLIQYYLKLISCWYSLIRNPNSKWHCIDNEIKKI